MNSRPDDTLAQLTAAGVSVWLDDISRERLSHRQPGAAGAGLPRAAASRPTRRSSPARCPTAPPTTSSWPTWACAASTSTRPSRAITTYDIRWACDVLRPVYDATDGLDGRVSIEVDPRLARDTAKTIAEARALWWLVDRPNLFIKIPATEAGLPGDHPVPGRGHQHQRHADLLAASATRRSSTRSWRAWRTRPGTTCPTIASVASFFVSRVDTEVDKRLDKIGTPEAQALRGKAAIANARLAYELFEQRFGAPRWEALSARGARVQRPLWASTSTKDPAYPDTMYVVDLVAPDTVNTMPEATMHAVADHGELRGNTIQGTYDESRQVFDQLEALGISYDDVVEVLEDEGVQKFATSWDDLLETIKKEMSARRTSGDQPSTHAR